MKQVKATVISNKKILKELERRRDIPHATRPQDTLGSYLIRLSCPEIAREAKPGQFIMVRCGNENVLPRPFSIHHATEDDISLFVAALKGGKGSQWLSNRQNNETVEVFGPLGNGFSLSPTARNLLLIAGGIGIAPLNFLAHKAISEGYSVTLLQGASGEWKSETKKNPPQLYPKKLLPARLEFETITSSSDGQKGMVTDLLPQFTGNADQIFACGPLPMYRDMARRKKQLGLEGKNTQVSLEVRMACGRGLCYGCSVKTRQGQKKVCSDGPVFNMDDIIWDNLVLL